MNTRGGGQFAPPGSDRVKLKKQQVKQSVYLTLILVNFQFRNPGVWHTPSHWAVPDGCHLERNPENPFIQSEEIDLRMKLYANTTNRGVGEALGLQKNDVYNFSGQGNVTYGNTGCQVFKQGVHTILERFLPKNQHIKRKFFCFENWCSDKLSKKIDFQSQFLVSKIIQIFLIFCHFCH